MSKTRAIEDPETMYKVLACLSSPIQDEFEYEIGREYHCDDFNNDPEEDCAEGFYATELEGLPYCWDTSMNIYEVEVWGKAVEIDEFKRRYENIRIIKELDPADVAERAKGVEEDLGYRLSEVIQPVDPREIDPSEITEEHVQMLGDWKSVRDSVGHWRVWRSVRDSVWESVWDSRWKLVWRSVRDSVGYSVGVSMSGSVRDSFWDSLYAYIGSLFFDVEDWRGVEHEVGEYPFQPAVDLWKQGLVPSSTGDTWRLHGGENMDVENMDILWEGKGD